MSISYHKETINNSWVITESGRDWKRPQKAVTFAFDTENLVLLDGQVRPQNEIFLALKDCKTEEKRKRLTSVVWAWQCYDEVNGFFMTNDFYLWLNYQCQAGYKFGWCYNATFDFSQIDYEILGKRAQPWKPREKKKGEAYNKAQEWAYESLHNDAGARYAYKLWIPYRDNKNRHKHVHSVDYRDFMKLCAGGLAKLLKDLDVEDNDGIKIRKLTMEYQAVDADNLTNDEIAYCCNDVKGLYFAIKKFNTTIEEQSNNECHIYGESTNIMTAGGFAKRELLRSLYPNVKPQYRVQRYQKAHPLTQKQDEFIRENHLYRGGVSYVNPRYKGKLLTASKMGCPMNRYDVNSEYPYAMSIIRDLVGAPFRVKMNEYLKMKNRDDYEAIYMLTSVTGTLKRGFIGLWYDPFKRDYVEFINESGLHLMFERELDEMNEWYDLEYEVEEVILLKRGGYAYKPFIDENYALKAKAKKDGNATVQQATKLKLNSSYGKLAERLQRRVGHYELNEETGAIHFVEDGIEESGQNSMNVIIGALVTSVARCYILSKIREVCGTAKNGTSLISKKFVYIDTDSIHAFADYDKADAFALGGLKLEAKCEAVKYIAPKTYIDIERLDGLTVYKDGKYAIELHTKGLNTIVVANDLQQQETLTLDYIDKKINYGVKYIVLCSMNVKGGKVLIPTEKTLARVELDPNYKVNKGYDGAYLNER